jgi:transposase
MRDYTGQSIFIGIDVHKKTYSVTAIFDGMILKRDRMAACPQKLIAYCHKFFPNARIFSAYEAGFCGFGLHRQLLENGIHNIVVHAASIEISARDRVKTDKRDSLKIATQLSNRKLKCIHIPSPEREAARFISRLREKLVRDKTRLGAQIKGFMNLNGMLAYNDQKRATRKWVSNLLDGLKDDSDKSFYLKMVVKRWIELDEHVVEIEDRLKLQVDGDSDLERICRSVPGIGPIASRTLINELGDMSQFKNDRSLYSFTGFTPQEYSSGEHTRQGNISRQGRPVLRKILVQAAWRAIKEDEGLNEVFERISERAGKKRAIVAVARRLIGIIRACLRENREYVWKRVTINNIVQPTVKKRVTAL